MKIDWKRSAASVAGLVAAFVLWSGKPAEAATVTFGTTAGHNIGQTYTEGGFQFKAGTVDGLYTDQNQIDHSISLVNYNLPDTITMTRSGGGNFNLASIDFAPYGAPLPFSDLSYSWVAADGTTSVPVAMHLTSGAWTHLLLSLTDIKSFSWTANLSGDAVWADNVVATPFAATPIPGALPLFAAGLGALGLAKRRRKNASVA